MSATLQDVRKTFGDTVALSSIDLDIKDGEFIAMLGPSGCGKTTLLRLLAGFETPTSGNIRIDDIEAVEPGHMVPPEKRNIGMVFQSFALWPHMKVKEQVQFPLDHHKYVPDRFKKQKKERMKEVLEMVGLQHYADRMPNELSGGQKQRVALARAVAAQPSLLLMDEPLSSLDAGLRLEMRREIQAIHRKTETSIVYVTHDQSEALAMADRVIVMNHGSIEQIGSPRDIYSFPQTEFTAGFVGKANMVPGTFTPEGFHPLSDTDIVWPCTRVASTFIENGTFPVRPEQFQLNQHGDGLKGRVVNSQFQGKEMHYVVEVQGHSWTVDTPADVQLPIGEEISISLTGIETPSPSQTVHVYS
ncbi:ABC transporter ATP-binding protein [Salibacterium halotolerans]|uniref:Iron(III) transport system ATP-binding protein n=1 Tax=Salibacterium halotolerans TaxID=1884432 RepID=A0A1I5KZY7_9BACI|nr:ABC transporter ATP-binding protein [Salibacterium halotolerans]SFO90690.1 iron(III) transport system ATP-binding protein [Salibacterium halotolerans]